MRWHTASAVHTEYAVHTEHAVHAVHTLVGYDIRRHLLFPVAPPAIAHLVHLSILRPALDMGLRLGEGSAAAIALPLAKAAATLIKEMASLDEALALAPPAGTRAV